MDTIHHNQQIWTKLVGNFVNWMKELGNSNQNLRTSSFYS